MMIERRDAEYELEGFEAIPVETEADRQAEARKKADHAALTRKVKQVVRKIRPIIEKWKREQALAAKAAAETPEQLATRTLKEVGRLPEGAEDSGAIDVAERQTAAIHKLRAEGTDPLSNPVVAELYSDSVLRSTGYLEKDVKKDE